jgi:hypothetical protein
MKTFKKYLFESLNKQDMAKLKPLIKELFDYGVDKLEDKLFNDNDELKPEIEKLVGKHDREFYMNILWCIIYAQNVDDAILDVEDAANDSEMFTKEDANAVIEFLEEIIKFINK